jgi:calcium-dependent protein kinase
METASTSIKFGKKDFVGKFEGVFLDNYDVLKQLGKGGYGKVYEVMNKKTKEIRACKHLSKLSIKNLEKFEREIEILRKADHPNIIKLYEIFESKRSFYLIMEECKGGEVFDRIIEHIQNKEMYSEKNAAIILRQMMSAVEYCHNNGIAHRDLKPENLLYLNQGSEDNNSIKVIDFGLSQVISPNKKLKTKVGTAYYVSPEILQGSYSEKCDIWSAGVILYILLSGDPPFNGPSDIAIYKKIAQMDFDFPEAKWANISDEAKDLIKHMIAPENERYNARQVMEHKWMNIVNQDNLANLNFDPSFLVNYAKSNIFKKMTLLFIASRLEDNEINHLKKIFEAFNLQKDGQISYQELKKGLKELKCCHISDEELCELFKSIDVDQNGKIDYTEFLAATIQKKIYLQEEKLFEAFCTFDKDDCGKIKKEELMSVLNADPQQEGEIEKIIKEVDKTGEGSIDYKEFLEMMGYDDQ